MTTYTVHNYDNLHTVIADSYRFANAEGIKGALVFYVGNQEVAVFKEFSYVLADQSTLPIVDVVTQDKEAA